MEVDTTANLDPTSILSIEGVGCHRYQPIGACLDFESYYIDTIGEHKDAHYICNVLVGYIEIIKVNNIVQIYINNAPNMKNMADFLIYHFPSLYFRGCITHFLDLLLED